MTYKTWVGAAMALLELSNRELAAVVDVPENTISRWASGDLPVRHDRILYYALRNIAAEMGRLDEFDQTMAERHEEADFLKKCRKQLAGVGGAASVSDSD